MKSKLLFTFLCLPVVACNLYAADSANRYSIRGAGLLTCKNYVIEREKKSDAYFMIGGWIDGIITGINQYAANTYDVTSFESTELLALIIQRHCEKNPEDRLYSVINTIFSSLHEDRIKHGSALVAVKVDDKQTHLYRELIRRIQQALTKRKLYAGKANGQFTPALEKAIKSFQQRKKMKPTGFPDQSTLWRLLRRELGPD